MKTFLFLVDQVLEGSTLQNLRQKKEKSFESQGVEANTYTPSLWVETESSSKFSPHSDLKANLGY